MSSKQSTTIQIISRNFNVGVFLIGDRSLMASDMRKKLWQKFVPLNNKHHEMSQNVCTTPLHYDDDAIIHYPCYKWW